MNVLIIDDSAFMRKALTMAIESAGTGLKVIDTARNGEEGLAKIQRHRPDVVTLDIEMPVMDGLTVLRKIKGLSAPHPAILVCSTLTAHGSQTALQALNLGAADVIEKNPSTLGAQDANAKRELIAKIRAVGGRGMGDVTFLRTPPRAPEHVRSEFAWPVSQRCDLVVVGSSTGGPPILEQVLGGIPADFSRPVVVAQHMPALFTRSMAQRLSGLLKVPVDHGEADCVLQPGRVVIIEGGKHGRLHRLAGDRLRLEVSTRPQEALYKPSVNELFQSAAILGPATLGIMLTGMGDDGCNGAKAMHQAGATILAQAPETCAVYGMPRAVVEAGVASAALTPARLAQVLTGMGVRSVRAA